MKPSWKNAPKWANWLAQDFNGVWFWYYSKPHPNYQLDKFFPIGHTYIKALVSLNENPNWVETLEERPKK